MGKELYVGEEATVGDWVPLQYPVCLRIVLWDPEGGERRVLGSDLLEDGNVRSVGRHREEGEEMRKRINETSRKLLLEFIYLWGSQDRAMPVVMLKHRPE